MEGSSSGTGGGPAKLSLKLKLGAPRPPPTVPSTSSSSVVDGSTTMPEDKNMHHSNRTSTLVSSTVTHTTNSSSTTSDQYTSSSSSSSSESVNMIISGTLSSVLSSAAATTTTSGPPPKLKLTLFKKPDSNTATNITSAASTTTNTTTVTSLSGTPLSTPSSSNVVVSTPLVLSSSAIVPTASSVIVSSTTNTNIASSSSHTLSSGYTPIVTPTPSFTPSTITVPMDTSASIPSSSTPTTSLPLPPLSTKLTGIASVDDSLRNIALAETGYQNRSITRNLLKQAQIPIAILKLYFDPDATNGPPLNAPLDIDNFHVLQRWPGDERGSTELNYHLQNATYIRSNEVQETAVPSTYDIYHINASNDVQSTTYSSTFSRKVRLLDNYTFCDDEGLPVNLFSLLLNQYSSTASATSATIGKSIQVFGTIVAGMQQTCTGIRGRPTYPSGWREGLQNIRKASIIGLRDQLKEFIEVNMSGSTVRRYATGNMIGDGTVDEESANNPTNVPVRRTVTGTTFSASKLQLPPVPSGYKLSREECHSRAKQLLDEARFPLSLTSQLTVESLGSISTRKGYHSERYVWPIGFRSVRLFTDILDPENRAPYTCEILDGGDNGPLFRVTYNSSMSWTGRTPTAAWTLLNEKLTETKRKLAGDDNVTVQRILSGPDLFGFAGSKAGNLIEGLPDALDCTKYNFLEIREPDVRKRKIVDVDNEGDNDQSTPSASNASSSSSSSAAAVTTTTTTTTTTSTTTATTSTGTTGNASSLSSSTTDSNQPKTILVLKRPKIESFEGKLYAAIRDIVQEDMGEGNEGGLSMKEVRRRAETALECDLSEKREVIRTMVERVVKEMDDAKGDDDDSNTNTETEDDDNSYVDPTTSSGGRRKPVKRRRLPGSNVASTVVTSNKALTFLAAPPDEESDIWPHGTSRQRLRIHIPSIRGIEIIFSGSLVDQFQGLPVLVLRSTEADYILATPESDLSPSRPCRSGARKLLHFYECCVSAVYALRKHASSLASFNYTQIINIVDTYGRQRVDHEFNSNDIRSSGLYADEDGIVKWADYLTILLTNVPERVLPRSLREVFGTAILLKNRMHQIDEIKHHLRTLLHLSETVIITGKREAELECFRVLGMDTADAIAFMRNVPVPDNLEADDDSRIVSRYMQAKEKKNTSIIDQKKLIRPLPTAIFDPSIISPHLSESILAAWGYLQTFSTTLNLLPYRLDDLAAALVYSVGDSALITQTFIALLRIIIEERIMNDDLRSMGAGENDENNGEDSGVPSLFRNNSSTGASVSSDGTTAAINNRGYYGIPSPPNTGTWQEYLRLSIENSLSDKEKGQVYTRLTEILLHQQLQNTNAMKIDDSIASVPGPLPALGMILELCARRFDTLIYEGGSSLLLTAPLDITLNPRFPDISSSWIDLVAIRKRLITGYYGTATDAEESLLNHTMQQPCSSAEDGGVKCGSVPGSGYKGFIADVRSLVTNCKYLGILETTSYGAALSLFGTNFETKLENEILPFAGRLAGNLKSKEVYQLRRQFTRVSLNRGSVNVKVEPGTMPNSNTVPSATLSPLDELVTNTDKFNLTDVCLLLSLMDFKLLPLGAKVVALQWCTDEAACTIRIRTIIDKNEDALTEAWQEAKRARDNYISFARKIDSLNYKQLVAKYFLDRLHSVDQVRTNALYDEVKRYAALLRSKPDDTKLIQLLSAPAIISSKPDNPFPDIVKTLTTEVIQDSDESQQSIQSSRIQLANAYRQLLSFSNRMLPIGYDRDHRRYWIMSDLGDTSSCIEEEKDATELTSNSILDYLCTSPRTTLRIFVEEVRDYASEQITDSIQRVSSSAKVSSSLQSLLSQPVEVDMSTTFGTIQAYPSIVSINQLLDWLMPNGIRERDTWSTVHALSNQLRKRLQFARYDTLVYRELLGSFVGITNTSVGMKDPVPMERRKIYENSLVHCSTTIMPDARSLALQMLKTILPAIHDTDKMAMMNKKHWRSATNSSSLVISDDTEGNELSNSPSSSGLAYVPHNSDDYPYCVYCGSIVSVRWYYVTLVNKTITAVHASATVSPAADGTVPERLCGDCYSHARSHHWTLRNLTHSEQAVTAISLRAIGPIMEKNKVTLTNTMNTDTVSTTDDKVSINPSDNSYALHLLDTVYVPRSTSAPVPTNANGKSVPLTLRLGPQDRKNSVSFADQEWIQVRKLLPLFAHYYSPLLPSSDSGKWTDYNYLQKNISAPDTVSSSLFSSYFDTVTALQVRLLQVEARLCHPKILPEWRYGRQRHEWRVQVATMIVPKGDQLNECLTILKSAIRSCIQSSSILSVMEEGSKVDDNAPFVSPSTIQLQMAQVFNSCRNYVNEIMHRTVRTSSKLLLELEEAMHVSFTNKRTAIGVVRESWEENRFEWCRDVQFACTLSALYVAAERLEERAIEWESIMDSVSEMERTSFLRITYEKGGGLPSSLVLENVPGVIATNTPLTSRGSNSIMGSSSIAYIPNEGEDVMYYGEGYAEAIQTAREYAAEAAANREKQLHSIAVGRGMGTRRDDKSSSTIVSSSSTNVHSSGSSGNESSTVRKTCSEILAPMMPVPGTALAKVLKVTYHGGDTEPYAKVQLGINRWLHSSVATLEPPNLNAHIDHHAQYIDNKFITENNTENKKIQEFDLLFARALEENYILPLRGVQILETEAGPGHGIPALAVQETTCSVCGGVAQISCNFDRCGRAYCVRCLGLSVLPPAYVCPIHYCGMCRVPLLAAVPTLRQGTNTGASCVACATSYCIECFNSHYLPSNGAPQRAGTTAPVNGGCVWDNSPVPSPYGTWRCTTCSMPVRRLLSVFRRALSAMRTHTDSGPFRQPADLTAYPDYPSIIKKPIDIQSMETKLAEGRYPSLISFLEDCKLLIDNCDTYCEGRYQNLPSAVRSVVYAGLRQLAHPYTLEQIRNAEIDYIVSQRGGTITDTSYGITGQNSRKDRITAFTDAASYLNYRYRKSVKEWIVKHPDQAGTCSLVLNALPPGTCNSSSTEIDSTMITNVNGDTSTWQRNSEIPVEDFVSAVLLLARRARSEALTNSEQELARIRASRMLQAQAVLEQDEETKRVIQDAAAQQAKAAADVWLHSQPSRMQSSYHTGFPEYVEKYNNIRDSTLTTKLTELRSTTLNHMMETTYYPATEQSTLYKLYLERAQFLHPSQESLIIDLENEFGPGAVPGYISPIVQNAAKISNTSSSSTPSPSVLDAYVQTFTVIVRLQALTSDFLIPLDRYVAAVGQKWTLRTEFATWRLTAPEGLIQSSGLQYGLHAAAVQRAITLTENHYRAPGKFNSKDLSATIRKNMMNMFQNNLQTGKHAFETNRPVVKLGKIYTGKVIGCVMMDTLTDTFALKTAFKSGLINSHEAGLRLIAVPWRCLTVRWYDLRYSKGSSMNYENIWESASLSSISRVNPWESMDTFDNPRTIDLAILPSIGPPFPGLPALWDIGIRPVLYLPTEYQTGEIRPLPLQISYVPEIQPVPPHLVIPPASIPMTTIIPSLPVTGNSVTSLVPPPVPTVTTTITTGSATPTTVVPSVPQSTVIKPQTGPVLIVMPGTTGNAPPSMTTTSVPTAAAVNAGLNVTLQVLQSVAAGRAALPGMTPIFAANLLSVPALAQQYLLHIQTLVSQAAAQGVTSHTGPLGQGMKVIAQQMEQVLLKLKAVQQNPSSGMAPSIPAPNINPPRQ